MGYDVGDAVTLAYETRDEDNNLTVAATVVLTVTLPDLTTATPAVTTDSTGEYEATYLFTQAGRHRFRWVSTGPNTAETFVVDVTGVGGNLPVLQDVKDYIGVQLAATYTDAALDDALDAERESQARACRIPANYPTDLRQALLRRVSRNLAMREIPLAVLQGDAETGSSQFLPGRDPEVRRLEAGHRKVVLG